jgi:transketolase
LPHGSSTLTNHDTDASLAPLAKRIRMAILRESKRAGVGHIGSALSVTEIIAALYGRAMRVTDPAHPDRDRFVLSKGHAALALYAALCERGWIDEATLATYCGDDTILGVHPDHALPGIDFSTGSLGQGLAFGAGAALAARLSGSDRRVFVLVSDAECNEGSVWESVMFAAQHKLANLVAIVDANGQQALDHTARVLDLSPLDERWAAFGWRTHVVDGHDLGQLVNALAGGDSPASPERAERVEGPQVVVARTVFGKGVSFMESRIKWHYMPMNDDEYRQAVAEVDG